MLIQNMLQVSAKNTPEKNAIWYKGTWTTYYDLDMKSDSLAWNLIKLGVSRGDRVALLLENSPEYAIAFFAVLKAGAIAVPLNTGSSSDELSVLLNHCEAKLMIMHKKYGQILARSSKTTSLKIIITDDKSDFLPDSELEIKELYELFSTDVSGPPSVSTIDIDPACIIYTSGSTGQPKGVMLSHLNMVSNTRSIVEYLTITSDDRIMVVLPFYYVYGKTLLLTHVFCGASIVIDNRFSYPNQVLNTMEALDVTGFAGVPSTYMILLSKSTLRERKFSFLRYVTQAGGAMAPAVQKQVAEVFAPAKLVVMYGATELSPRLTYVPPDMLDRKWGSIGIPIPNCEAYVSDENGIRLSPDMEGEVVGRGSNVMMGYYRDPEATSRVVRNGLYFTGDRGYMDKDGYIFVVGRSSDMLKIGGRRVSAREIEDALLSLGFIEEAAVIGISDEILGEAARAFIVLNKNCRHNEIQIKKELARTLPLYKIPTVISIKMTLPKNEAGKILKAELKKPELGN